MLSMPPADDEVIVTAAQIVGGGHQGAHAGAAHFIDGHGAGRGGASGGQRRLTCRGLADARGQHAAEINLVEIAGLEARAVKGAPDGRRAQLRGRHAAQGTLKSADRCPSGAQNNDVLHIYISDGRRACHTEPE